jgi:hypothetical protein
MFTLLLVIYVFINSFDGRNLRGDYEVKPQKFGIGEWLLNILWLPLNT